ncbi:MAG: LacI family DNA-binding transcriptional regulator [Lachnospiraceae bacterium]|nr:LacI family DNA-binding transcriptional regulator [Lachnospiraceae bacterium]
MNQKTTLQSIAQSAGVSVSTVHKALYGKPGVNPEMRKRILLLAKQQGYRYSQPIYQSIRIAAVFPAPEGSNRFFYQYIWNGIHDRADELEDQNLTVIDFKFYGGIEEQLVMLEDLYQNHCEEIDCLLTIAWDQPATAEYIDKFAEKNILTFTVSSDAPMSQRCSFIGANFYSIGRIAGEYMKSVVQESGRTLIVGTRRDSYNHSLAIRGYYDELNRGNDRRLEVVELFDHTTQDFSLQASLSEFLHSFKNIRGIYANNARATIGVCQLLEEISYPTKLTLIGSELFEESAHYLKCGILDCVIEQGPYQQGYVSVGTAFNHLSLKRSAPPNIVINAHIILPSCVDQKIIHR